MKKTFLSATMVAAVALFACNNDGDTASSTDSTSTTSSTTTTDADTANNTTATTTGTPLQGMDSTFAMEAASGGMMEVEAGNLAQQNASSQRVKDFAAMMVRDHSKANEELKSIVTSKGMMLPDSMIKKHRDHVEMMRKMTGKAFDKHYMDMMTTAHKEDISKFENASKNAMDADIKAFAGKTLPVLQMHRDSAVSINKMKM